MSQVNDAKNAMSAMQKVNDAQKKLGLDESGRPPMCHVVVNCIVGIIFPSVGHWLARPDDVKSLSFFGTLAAQISAYILGYIWDFLAALVHNGRSVREVVQAGHGALLLAPDCSR